MRIAGNYGIVLLLAAASLLATSLGGPTSSYGSYSYATTTTTTTYAPAPAYYSAPVYTTTTEAPKYIRIFLFYFSF